MLTLETLEDRRTPNRFVEADQLFQLVNVGLVMLSGRHQDYPWPQQELIHSEGRVLWDLDLQRYESLSCSFARNAYTWDTSDGLLELYGRETDGTVVTLGTGLLTPNGAATVNDSNPNHFVELENRLYARLVYSGGLEVVEELVSLKPVYNQYALAAWAGEQKQELWVR